MATEVLSFVNNDGVETPLRFVLHAVHEALRAGFVAELSRAPWSDGPAKLAKALYDYIRAAQARRQVESKRPGHAGDQCAMPRGAQSSRVLQRHDRLSGAGCSADGYPSQRFYCVEDMELLGVRAAITASSSAIVLARGTFSVKGAASRRSMTWIASRPRSSSSPPASRR